MKKILLMFVITIAIIAQPLEATATAAPSSSEHSSATSHGELVTAYIIKEINVYRSKLGLDPVQINDETCNFAKIRAYEIKSNFSHDGFNQRTHSKTLPYAHWRVITENIAMTSDYKQVERMWENSPGHAKNMRADTPYVCVIQDGDYFDYVGLKP